MALVVACLNPWDKPTDPLYLLPEAGQEPLFDCSAFPTHFSHLGTSSIASVPLGYGGAAVERFVTPTDLRLSHTSPGAVRMKVVAVPVEGITTVTEVVKGSSVLLTGLYENVYVVLVNVDPLGEVITEEEQAVWKRSTYSCQPGQGSCWTFARPGMNYSDNMITGLVTPPISLPLTSPATLSLDIKFVLQGSADPTRWVKGCAADRLVGYDGVQLRARVGDATHVLLPTADSNFPYSMVTDPTSGTVFRGSVLSFFGYYLHYAGLCDYLVGWIGDSLGWKTNIAFDLSLFQGQTVELEVFFASDSEIESMGVWVDNIKVQTNEASPAVLFFDTGEAGSVDTMLENFYNQSFASRVGEVDMYTDVPYSLDPDSGLRIDYSLFKANVTQTASLTASWTQASPESSYAKAWLGAPYAQYNFTFGTLDEVFVRDYFEVLCPMTAPFDGTLINALTWGYVDKSNMGAIKLNVRSALPPYEVLFSSEEALSPLPLDSGTHSFTFANGSQLMAGQDFYLGYEVVRTETLEEYYSGDFSSYHRVPLSGPSDLPAHAVLVTEDAIVNGFPFIKGTFIPNAFGGRTMAVRAFFAQTTPGPAGLQTWLLWTILGGGTFVLVVLVGSIIYCRKRQSPTHAARVGTARIYGTEEDAATALPDDEARNSVRMNLSQPLLL